MTSSLIQKSRKRWVYLVGVLIIALSGCQLMTFLNASSPKPHEKRQGIVNKIKKIYIQSFIGPKIAEVQKVFFEAIHEQTTFSFVEILPDDTTNLKILRIEVVDYNAWDTTEEIVSRTNKKKDIKTPPDLMGRRNAIVSMKINLLEAETGNILINKLFSQPFQQIYIGKDAIKHCPDKRLELRRLTKILIFRILSEFYNFRKSPGPIRVEEGVGYDWVSKYIYNLGNGRIKKGNRMARAKNYSGAIQMWQLVLFNAEKNEPEEVYLKNRASAYYNIGLVYDRKKEWWAAASMFSRANRVTQKLKYAQAWGNSMRLWLNWKRKGETGETLPKPTSLRKSPIVTPKEDSPLEKENLSLTKEKELNSQFLLNAKELWPLDPYIKNHQPRLDTQVIPGVVHDQDESGATNASDLMKSQGEPEKQEPATDLIENLPVEPIDLTE